jgi:hypothetical protein
LRIIRKSCFQVHQPILLVYLDEGRSWKRDNITLKMLKEKKASKMGISPVVEKYWNELVVLLENNKEELFPSS